MAYATRPLAHGDYFQPRLFFLNQGSFFNIKRNMPQYRDSWDSLDSRTQRFFSVDDGMALNSLIATLYDEAKLQFVYRPFNDLGENHGYLLLSDPSLLGKLRLKNLHTQSYTFNIWPGCDFPMQEEKLTPSMGSRYFINAVYLRELLKSIAPSSPILRWNSKKIDREATLREVYYADTHQLTPIPELFRERGWTFEHFGFCSILEPADTGPGSQLREDTRTRNLKISLKTGRSVQLHRLVDLRFFHQFRQSLVKIVGPLPPGLSKQLQFLSQSPQNVSTPAGKFQNAGKTLNPNLIPVLGPPKKLSNLSSSANLLVSQSGGEEESWETYPIPAPRKINPGTFTMSTQLPLLSPLQEKDKMTIYSPIETAAEDPRLPRFDFDYSSTSTLAQPEDATQYLNLSKKKMNKLSFGKHLKLSSQRFSISFVVGEQTVSVGHKAIKSTSIRYVQKILRVLETGYPKSKDKKKNKSQATQTENAEFGQQWGENQQHEKNQTTSRNLATINQQLGFGEMQPRKVITLAQYKNKQNSNWAEQENETEKVQDSKIAQVVPLPVTESSEKVPEIQEKSKAVEKLELKSNQILATPRKPKIVRKMLTPKQFELPKESQAIINQTLEKGLGLKLPELFQNVQKKTEEQVLEKQNVKSPETKRSEDNQGNGKNEHDIDNDLLDKVVVPISKDDDCHGDVGIRPSDIAVEPGPSILKLRRSVRKAKSKMEPKHSTKTEILTRQAIKGSRKRKADDGEIPLNPTKISEAKRNRVAYKTTTRKILKRLQPSKRFEPGILFKPNSGTTRMLYIKREVKQEPMEEVEMQNDEIEIEQPIFIKEELDLDSIAQASECF